MLPIRNPHFSSNLDNYQFSNMNNYNDYFDRPESPYIDRGFTEGIQIVKNYMCNITLFSII